MTDGPALTYDVYQEAAADPRGRALLRSLRSPYRRFRPRLDRPDLFDEQTSAARSKSEVTIVLGGTGSGKTEVCAYRTARRVRETPPPRPHCPFWIIGDTYDLVCSVCWVEKLSKYIPASMIHSIDWYKKNRRWPYAVLLKHPTIPGAVGWSLEFKSFEQGRERMQAASIGGAWFNEQPPLDIVDEVSGRTRDYNSPIDIDFTPLLPTIDWPVRYRKPPAGWRFFHLNSELNTALAEGWIKRYLDSIPEDYRETRRIGLFSSFKGSVFKDWRYDRHVVPAFEIPDDALRFRGIDFGYTDPFVCVWLARLPRTITLADGRLAMDGTWVLYREHVKAETLLIDHARTITNAEPWEQARPDVYGPTIADHDAQDAAELRKHGVYTVPAEKGPASVKAGVFAMQSLMLGGSAERAPRFLVFEDCKRFIQEVSAYRYEPGTNKRNSLEFPVKKDDHAIDAVRYALVHGLKKLDEFPTEKIVVAPPDWRRQAGGFLGRG